jgi:alpha-glucosidase
MCVVTAGDIVIHVHEKPYYLEWFFRGMKVLCERRTGSVAFSRSSDKLWHFHDLPTETKIFGLGERAGRMNRRGKRFEMSLQKR